MAKLSDKEILKRLEAVRAIRDSNANRRIVEAWVNAGRFYDELSNDEKYAYAEYYQTDIETLEACETVVKGSLHFKLSMRVPVHTMAEFNGVVKEVEQMLQEDQRS